MPETKDRNIYTDTLRVRLRPEDKELIVQAAQAAHDREGAGDLSSWTRRALMAAARRELRR